MLSVDPIPKYLQNYILYHSCHPFDVARTSLHPLNDTQQTRRFIGRSIAVGRIAETDPAVRRAELRARAAARNVRVARAAMLLFRRLEELGCRDMARLLSVGLLDTRLSARWRTELPVTVIVPSDDALARDGHACLPLTAPGRDQALIAG